ncbi:MAG: hypothetical protein ACYCW6_18820, partial [Candidatus Xenobia bacterium]
TISIVNNGSNSSVTVTQGGSAKTFTTSGTQPLTLFVQDGNVNGISGTLNGQLTVIATDNQPTPPNPSDGKGNIVISGNLIYHNSSAASPNPSSSDVLGLVAVNNISIAQLPNGTVPPSTTPRSATAPGSQDGIEVDGSLLALHTINVQGDAPANTSVGNLGNAQFFGGIIDEVNSATFSVDGESGTDSRGLPNNIHGYIPQITYDSRLPSTPPPSFPTTGRVVVMAVRDSGALNQ